MSVMQRNAYGGSVTGQPLDYAEVQRQSLMNQLGQQPGQPQATTPSQPQAAQPTTGEPRPVNMGNFARGGESETKQLPSMAGQNAEKIARTGLGVAGTVAGAFNPVTLGTNYAADKLRVKEETPTFGGEFGDITDPYGRRFEGTGGGVKSEALRYAGYGAMAGPIGAGIGAAAGAIKALATKNAPSAYSDFSSQDAADAVQKGYQKYLGRDASEEEIKNQLVGQGWKPDAGDRWVGEKGLFSVLGQIRDSPEAQQFAATGLSQPAREAAQRDAMMQQLAGSSPATAGGATGAATGGGGGGVSAASNPGTWNTDGYAAPQVTAQAAGAAPPGWDADKWNNTDHQTPKYAVGRILSQFPPTVQGLAQAAEQVAAAYPGATFNGKDKLTIPGVGEIDVLKGAGNGGEAWQWLPADEGGAAPAKGGSGEPVTVDGARSYGNVPDTLDSDTIAQLKARLQEIINGQPNREAVLAGLGAGNG